MASSSGCSSNKIRKGYLLVSQSKCKDCSLCYIPTIYQDY